jgi:3-oxoacyl-[acyl-carrier-protein] synthase II
MNRRAVITGVGVVSPFGVGADVFWDALAAGGSAVRPIRSFDASTFPTRVAGEVPVDRIDAAWILDQIPDRQRADGRFAERLSKALHACEQAGVLRDRKVAFGLVAALEAWRGACCDVQDTDAWLCLALGLEQALLQDFASIFSDGQIRWRQDAEAALPSTRFRAPVDVCARLIAETLCLAGPRVVHTSACAAGALSLAHGAALIERGDASLVVCGAADSMVNPLGIGGMARLGAPSPRNEPDACRPFDRRRDGLAVGEGAAIFVLEEASRAAARGARPLAVVLGWGSSQDAYKASAPRPDGTVAARAMRRALDRAGLGPEAVGYINAHGTGTPLNDPAEVLAIRAALGGAAAERVPVSSIKGAVGHLMAASGAIEIAACLLAFERDILPGTAHHQESDPECDLDIIGALPRRLRVDHVISNSFGFGGQNACVVLGRCA